MEYPRQCGRQELLRRNIGGSKDGRWNIRRDMSYLRQNVHARAQHWHEGQYIKSWDILVCRTCYDANWDGLNPHAVAKLIAYLKEHSLPIPPPDANGCVHWPS